MQQGMQNEHMKCSDVESFLLKASRLVSVIEIYNNNLLMAAHWFSAGLRDIASAEQHEFWLVVRERLNETGEVQATMKGDFARSHYLGSTKDEDVARLHIVTATHESLPPHVPFSNFTRL